MKNNKYIPIALFSIVAVIYVLPIFNNIFYWGQMDWDQFTFWNAVPRETILKYHQFPLWNPYSNGGNVLLAHPHSLFLSPMYIFVLILGPIIGLKIEIAVHLIVGLFGMFQLSRCKGLSDPASYLASFVFMLNSVYVLHLTEGHASWLPMAFMPWTVLYYLKSIDDRKKVLGAIISLGMMLIAGSIDVFLISVVFLIVYSFLKMCQLRSFAPITVLFIIFVGTFLLCSVKLFPMIEFIKQFPRTIEGTGGTSLAALYDILLGRGNVLTHDIRFDRAAGFGLMYEWHEYGAYIGVIPLVIYIVGVACTFKKLWPMVLTGLISLWIALGDWSYINMWAALHSLPILNSFQVPSRFILGFIFSVSLLAGSGFDHIKKLIFTIKYNKAVLTYNLFIFAILFFIVFDLWKINSPAFALTFSVPPIENIKHANFAQRYDSIKLHGRYTHSSMYTVFLRNSGILDGYEVLNVKKGDVRIVSDPKYKGEVYLDKADEGASIKYFSPNKIIVNVSVYEPDILMINQNYYTGWKVKTDGKVTDARSKRGLIATPVLPGHHTIIFYYMPTSFLLGLFVTVSFILFAVTFVLKSQKWCMLYEKRKEGCL